MAHKPLFPLFNKSTAKLPPRIEKSVMDVQDVDFELVYQPGKDETDPLDYLSRHPVPIRGNDDTKKIIRHTIRTEHAIVIDRIRDHQMKKLSAVIQREDRKKHRKDPEIQQSYSVRQNLALQKD